MPKHIPQNELDAVLRAVGQFPEGAPIKDVSAVMEKLLPRRTLQRRLGQLIAQKKLILKGSVFLKRDNRRVITCRPEHM